MTVKVHGAAYPGIWVEKQVTFVTVTFAASVAVTTQYSGFDVVESCVVQALKDLETRATVLGVSQLSSSGLSFQVMLGYAEGFFSNNVGVISTATPVTGKAVDLTNPLLPVPAADLTTTYSLSFAYWDGSLPVATAANGALAIGPGSTSGAVPANSATGTPGYYPTELDAA